MRRLAKIKRRARVFAAVGCLLSATSATAILVSSQRGRTNGGAACSVIAGRTTYKLAGEQAALATTIAVVGVGRLLPPRAVTIALATALRESGLRNLSHGDRDSLGVFQQRPSQGWGTQAQIMTPTYAANAFYASLVRVPGWQKLSVNDAAQAVQRSALPKAYAQWEPNARALAGAFTGSAPGTFTCRSQRFDANAPPLRSTLAAEMPTAKLDARAATPQGWAVSSWLVARAGAHRINAISFGDQRWSSTTGTWSQTPQRTDVVTVTPAGAVR